MTDASPFGMGGVRFRDDRPIERWACPLSAGDLALFDAERGDPAWQAEWELLALLLSVAVWSQLLRAPL